jgi:hypothetical protein
MAKAPWRWIDPTARTKAADIPLKAHPEGFQIDETGTRAFVNVPDAREIQVVELAAATNRPLPMRDASGNFPMAIDGEAHRVLVVFRSPPTLTALSSRTDMSSPSSIRAVTPMMCSSMPSATAFM